MYQHINEVYEAPFCEVLELIQEESFLESGESSVTQSDKGMESYGPGEIW